MSARLEAAIDERERVLTAFLEAEQAEIALAAHALARAFARGATLYAFGSGAAATDAAHVAVEFMHPVIVGKRALPALALTNDPTGRTTLAALARPGDIAFAIDHGDAGDAAAAWLEAAAAKGLLTISLGRVDADHAFTVPSNDPYVVQEAQETLYHVLWELVHVFFEHPGLLTDACITCGDVAVEARVVSVAADTATIERDGLREEVAVELVAPVAIGDRVLCHAGVALEKLDA